MEMNKGDRKLKAEDHIMEEYIESVISPLEDLISPATIEMASSSSRSREKLQGSDYGERTDQLMQKERIRRDIMSENYSRLQSIVPNLVLKASREMIVTETIEYIRRLEEERRRLERLKNSISSSESMAEKFILSTTTNRSSSLNVTTSGCVAFFGIQLVFRQRLVANIFRIFENHRTEILAANVSVDDQRQQLTLTVTAMVDINRDETIEKIKREIMFI